MACPDPSALARLHQGKSPADEAAALEEHLEGCGACRAEMARLAAADSMSGDTAPLAVTLSAPGDALFLERGTQVGRYVLLEQLGSGGMGVVYAAMDPELGRKVALKLMRSGRGDGAAEVRTRLLREAQAMARLSHPNVISVYDVGSHGSQVYIAMELVQGTTLKQWIKPRRPWRDTVGVFCKAGRGLGAAHQAGLIHRDFKPDNVLVGDDGSVHVTDFGLARQAGRESPADKEAAEGGADLESGESDLLVSALTRKGDVVGTPAYMSPEQFVNDVLDARTDQFSFCVALYEALYREMPFQGDTVKQLAIRVMGGQVPSLPRDPRVPLTVHRALVRGMSPSPADRHPSMEALVATLERAAWIQRRALGLAAVLVLAVAGLVWSQRTAVLREVSCTRASVRLTGVWDRGRRRAIRDAFAQTRAPYADASWSAVERTLDAYAASWAAAHNEACEATWVRHEQSQEVFILRMSCLERRRRELETLTQLFSRSDAQVVERGVQAATGLTPVASCAELDGLTRHDAPAPEVRERVEALRGRLSESSALQGAGQLARSIDLASTVADEARELHYRPLESEARLLRGRLKAQQGDAAGAEQDLQEAYWAAERAQRHDLSARALIGLVAAVGERPGRQAEGHLWAQTAAAVIEGLGQPVELRAQLLGAEAKVFTAEGRHSDALERLREALGLREQSSGPDAADAAVGLEELAQAYGALGRTAEALDADARALPILEQTYGAEHPRVAGALNRLGEDLLRLGKPVEALARFEQALRICEAQRGDASALARLRFDLARGLWEAGGDRGRARELATAAHQAFAGDDPERKAERDAIAVWMLHHEP